MAGGPLKDILVGTEDGLRRLSDEAVLLEGPVTALAGDGAQLWTLTDGSALWRGQGDCWEQMASTGDQRGRCLLGGPAVLVGTARARLMRLGDGRLLPVEGFEAADGRDRWYTPWGGPPDTRSLSAGPDGSIYANVHVGGILRSDDGETWTSTIDIDADVHQVVAHQDRSGTVLAACAWGLAVSGDGGGTWSVEADGLHGSYARAVAVSGEAVLVSASTGPFTDRAAVYRRPLDADGPFERCSNGLPEWFPANIDSHCLAASGATAAFGTEDGRIFRSDDEGRTWHQAASGLPAVRAVIIRPG